MATKDAMVVPISVREHNLALDSQLVVNTFLAILLHNKNLHIDYSLRFDKNVLVV